MAKDEQRFSRNQRGRLPDERHRRRTAGVNEQPRGTQHKTVCDWQEELSLCQHPPKGTEASAILYSLVETAKETGVDPYTYFVYTLTEAANLREAGENDKISKLTPAHFKQQMQIPSNRPQV